MVAGAASGDGGPAFDVALFVGYHARAGHPTGTIAHTYTGGPVETRLNGRPTGEYGFNALALGAWGIPVGLVAGDDALAAEVEGWLPWAERVVVKEGFGSNAAASLHPERAREAIREGATRAVQRARAGELRILEVGRRSSSRSTTGAAWRPTTPRSCPAPERTGDGPSDIRAPIR
jgi:D-amino peptidase